MWRVLLTSIWILSWAVAAADGPRRIDGPLGDAASMPGVDARAVWIVQLRAPAALTERAVSARFVQQKQYDRTQVVTRKSGGIESRAASLKRSHEALLGTLGNDVEMLHSYRYALNGFAARTTAEQAAR